MNGEGDMSVKDHSTIMLFGKKIPVPEYHIPATSQKGCQIQPNSTTMNACSNLKQTRIEMPRTQNIEIPKNSSKQENESKVTTSTVEDTMEASSTDQDKVLKKPDKIVQCPRCNSFDTKFCYFNNYNVNQPRHFCRNCHRYWTAGGTMRNVAVGAGRRKNKHIGSQYRQMIVASGGTPAANLEANDSLQHDNGIVLKFGLDVDASANNGTENREESSSLCVSSVTNGYTRGTELTESEQNRSKPLQSYPASSWIIPMNQSWNNVTSMVQSSMQMYPTTMQWCHAPMVAVTNIFTPNISLQFVPGSYGNGNVSIGSNGCTSPSSSTTSNSLCSGNGSPILGKHTRDSVLTHEEKPEMRVFAPKTLRIDETNLE
ncbi:hypothetical protein P8452_14486 [Trifolium repens]|nr:hypothetical protein P8452_14486 [Trifolium repens]